MRVNVYAEEMTNQIEIVEKITPEGTVTGIRFYLHLPTSFRYIYDVAEPSVETCAAVPVEPNETGIVQQLKGPFIHRPDDDDSSAVTFWGKAELKIALRKTLDLLEVHTTKNQKRG